MTAGPAPEETPSRRFSGYTRAFAWGGGVLFVLSLGYFLYSYFVTFGEITAGALAPGPLIVDASLFTVFALHHSVFAREGVRAWVARHIRPANERSAYVWVASLMLIAVCALWQPLPGVVWDVSAVWKWAFRATQVFGLWLSIRGAVIIDVWDLAGINPKSHIPHPESQSALEFKVQGPYGWVRHPIYLGWFLIVFATPRMTMTQLTFAIISCVYILIAIPFEERSLLRASGGTYERYREHVRWKLLPRLY